MKTITWRDRLRYQFDKSMAAGPIALIGWLAVISLVVIVIAGLFLAVTGIAPEGACSASNAPLGLECPGSAAIIAGLPRHPGDWAIEETTPWSRFD